MENGKDKSTGGGRSSWSVMDTVIDSACGGDSFLCRAGGVCLSPAGEDTKTTMYSVRFTVEDIHREALESVRAFDDVYLYDTGERLGNIGVYENKDGTQKVAFAAIPAGGQCRDGRDSRTEPGAGRGRNGCGDCSPALYRAHGGGGTDVLLRRRAEGWVPAYRGGGAVHRPGYGAEGLHRAGGVHHASHRDPTPDVISGGGLPASRRSVGTDWDRCDNS